MLDYREKIRNSLAFEMTRLDAEKNRLSHAYLFCHSDSSYSKCFSEMVSQLFLGVIDNERDIMRIEKRIHPDVIYFGEEKPVDAGTASKIVEMAQISPFEADKKIFVICAADEMNESSQNKLLKTIEEPPKNTYFILLAKSPSKLLSTILSRVKQIELDEIKAEELEEMLSAIGVDAKNAAIFANCSAGNGEFAEKLALDGGFIEFFNSVVSCLKNLSGSKDVLKFSSVFSAKNVDKEEFFNIMMMLIRDVQIALTKKYELISFKNIQNELIEISSGLNFVATKTLIDACLFAKKQLKYNVNPTSVVDTFLFKLAEVKIRCRKL